MRQWKKIKITLTTEAPFRIGGVKPIPGTTDIDSPVVKLGDKIVVQGTSLKGAYRAELERYFIDTYFDRGSKKWKNEWLKPCIPADEKTISADEQKLVNEGLFKYSCEYPAAGKYVCAPCYLLGARGLVGFVHVPFLNLTKGSSEPLAFIRKDRVSGTSAHGALAKFEAIPEGSTFEGTMNILLQDDVIGWSLGQKRSLAGSLGDKWLEMAGWNKEKIEKDLIIDRLQNIKHVGGYLSKGFGVVKIKAEAIG
jgi:CRISPR/Cas system CSM-associated protein Csm3 (group 7 of RAMP superfamily)